MSYLDLPRLYFSGSFFADPSTINIDPGNYDPSFVLQGTNQDAPAYESWSCDSSILLTLRGCGSAALGSS
jgi:hypothetical protein